MAGLPEKKRGDLMEKEQKKNKDVLKIVKRIAALLGAVLLVGMYVLTMISGILARPETGGLFRACIYCSITIPCLLYAFELIYRVLSRKNRQEEG